MDAACIGCVSKYLSRGSARLKAFWERAGKTTQMLVPGEYSDKAGVGCEAVV